MVGPDGISRRGALRGGAALATAFVLPQVERPFAPDTVAQHARDLAQLPYRAPDTELPAGVGALDYDQYRGIRFRMERALWRDRGLPFQIGFFPRGFLYRRAIVLYEVAGGQAVPIRFSPDLFESDDRRVPVPEALGFAGFRVHAPINSPGAFEEFCVFLGASYFRAVGRGQQYGLSARGLAIGTGAAKPEEFPDFRAFWLERPGPDSTALVLHALLDSPSATGAFRFTLRPGAVTTMDVQSKVFPRVDIDQVGIAPLTSMYFFADTDHNRPAQARVDDWRSAVHDSDGLAVETGQGEQLWRPLANPATLQFSAFVDVSPRGFGLLQRKRGFDDFGDLQVLYGHRPSLWVEPVGGWGPGSVDLVEIPTASEYNDNIVAFWRGREALRGGREYQFTYRMHWGPDPGPDPGPADGLARVAAVRSGAGQEPGRRVFVLDLAGPALRGLGEDAPITVELSASAGSAVAGYTGPVPEAQVWRISIDFDPQGAVAADLRCRLMGPAGPLSETWLYRWTS